MYIHTYPPTNFLQENPLTPVEQTCNFNKKEAPFWQSPLLRYSPL